VGRGGTPVDMSAPVSRAPSRVEKIRLPYRFNTRTYQAQIFKAVADGCKRIAWNAHRRSGKDATCWNLMIKEAALASGVYHYVGPTLGQVKRNVWEQIGDNGQRFMDNVPPNLLVSKNQAELKLVIRARNGESIIQLLGTDSLETLRGSNCRFVVFSEYSYCDPRAFDLYRPILAHNGGTALFQSTPLGRNHFYDLYRQNEHNSDWFCVTHDVGQTRMDARGEDGSPVVTEEQIEAERKGGMSEEWVDQEFWCKFSGIREGTVFGRLVEAARAHGRICAVPVDIRSETFVAMDLGYSDATAVVWAQFGPGGAIHLVDYEEWNGKTLAECVSLIKAKPYSVSTVFMPHDAKVHDYGGSGDTRLETARRLGLNVEVLPKRPISEGIDLVRSIFGRLIIDESKCSRLVDCLTTYHLTHDAKTNTYSKDPAKSWANHGCDSLRYLAHAVESGLVYLDRITPTTCTGMSDSVWGNPDDEEDQPRRNALGGFITTERKYTLEKVTTIDPVTGREVTYYK
jgi:phage terminase large subunit